jgi:hypothetical protein
MVFHKWTIININKKESDLFQADLGLVLPIKKSHNSDKIFPTSENSTDFSNCVPIKKLREKPA